MTHALFNLDEAAKTDLTVQAYLETWEVDRYLPDSPTREELLEALAAQLAHEKAELRSLIVEGLARRSQGGGYIIEESAL